MRKKYARNLFMIQDKFIKENKKATIHPMNFWRSNLMLRQSRWNLETIQA